MDNSFLSRKFVFGLILIIMGFVFTVMKMCTVEQFFVFGEVVGGTYVVGNVSAGIVNAVSGPTTTITSKT